MKEYLTKNSNGEYQLVNHRFSDDDIEVPEAAIKATIDCDGDIYFWNNMDECFNPRKAKEWLEPDSSILSDFKPVDVWQRDTQQVDNVNHPSHYTQGGIECIEAIKASMSHEAFCGYLKGNVQKYMWRYEKKANPVEDLKKARWYQERLIAEQE